MITIHTVQNPPALDMPVPDVYFRSGYGHACAAADESCWVLIEALDGRWQLPLLLSPTPSGATDAASPYGYSGVYASETLSVHETERAWAATLDALRDIGVVAAFLRHSPLVPQARPTPAQRLVIENHPTRLIELSTDDVMWTEMQGRCRTAIRKARTSGIHTCISPATAARLGPDGHFRRIYDETMARKGAGAHLTFDDEYYERLRRGLSQDLWVGEAMNPDGEVITAMLFMQHAGTFHYHLSGSTPSGARTGSNNLLIWDAIRQAAAHGAQRFHLGGGLAAGDSLENFKRSFGGRPLSYFASGLTIDEDRYRREMVIAAGSTPAAFDDLEASTFFPAYRRVRPAAAESSVGHP